VATCTGTGKMPNLTCGKTLADWQKKCNKCAIVLKYRQKKKKENR